MVLQEDRLLHNTVPYVPLAIQQAKDVQGLFPLIVSDDRAKPNDDKVKTIFWGGLQECLVVLINTLFTKIVLC